MSKTIQIKITVQELEFICESLESFEKAVLGTEHSIQVSKLLNRLDSRRTRENGESKDGF
jgi:hypothetical protein